MYSPHTYEEKPYNQCLSCIHIGKKCDGPNFLAMTTERWCEWVRLRKEYLDWTNAQIAEQAEVSKVSVDRIMSGNIKDIRTTTMQAVTKALVNGSWGQYPCALAAIETTTETDNSVLINECENLRKALANEQDSSKRKVDFLKEQVSFIEKQLEAKDEQLHERYNFIKRKDRIITILSVILGVLVTAVIGVLIFDLMNGHFGYFRY